MYQVPKQIYKPDPVDGEKIWMVATECIMTLYALLYAFPHIPGALLEDVFVDEGEAPDEAWFSVMSTSAMRAAMESILKTSEVLLYSLSPNKTLDKLTKEIVSKDVSNNTKTSLPVADVDQISEFFDLHLNDPMVPGTCRQMYDSIAAVYRTLNNMDITTREDLRELYMRYQLLPTGYQLPGLSRVEMENRSALVRFCSELAVQWMQPYFSKHPVFYMPELAAAAVCKGRV